MPLPKGPELLYSVDMKRIIAFMLALTLQSLVIPRPVLAGCQEWFKNGKLSAGKDCLVKCASLMVDMSTFDCPNSCDELCGSPQNQKWLFKLTDLYPGLTPAEKALSAQYPITLLDAYQQSWKAEELCLKEFPRSDTNDASDACRHFVWAVLLTRKFGKEMAKKILDAHEQEPLQPEDQKSMDLANNQQGVTFINGAPKDLMDEQIMAEFRKLLKEGKLVVLKKGEPR
jgi:hypothetical protein